MKLKIILSTLILIFCVQLSQAQQSLFSLQYSIGFPASQLSDYISEPSFRGFSAEYGYITSTNVYISLSSGINTFYERQGYGTYTEGTVSISGTQYRYTNSVPVMVSLGYFLMPEQTLSPYASLGVGAVYTLRNTDIGSYRTETETWHFALRPEVGVIYNISPRFGLKAAGKYYHTFETSDLAAQSFLSLDIGVVFSGNR